ncbi:hypothetical protein IWX90DRAFT_197376 [Phyllosticta citrichinensis]|uniref:Uncharacterized protein n=1 Tax=Phyllosticta citrichinensis TaxID=1130410 RepID=A0ABR1XXP6_9PEZI
MSSRATHVHPTHRTTTASGMRRNLFNSTLSRRPTAPSTTSATSATTLHLADIDDEEGEGRQGHLLERDRDMVARDKDGNYKLDTPMLGPLLPDEESEEKGEHGERCGSHGRRACHRDINPPSRQTADKSQYRSKDTPRRNVPKTPTTDAS